MSISRPRHLATIARWCHRQPDVEEVYQWDCFVFKVKGKVFAICSSDSPLAISLKPRRENLDAYLYHPDIDIARYVGRYGWVTITVSGKDTAHLALDLVQESYGVISTGKSRIWKSRSRD
jgi:predicted DNA-binding protein (MmcQ/YjbR family)